MAINVNNSIRNNSPNPDFYWSCQPNSATPWTSLQQANEGIPDSYKGPGKFVFIGTPVDYKIYVYRDGLLSVLISSDVTPALQQLLAEVNLGAQIVETDKQTVLGLKNETQNLRADAVLSKANAKTSEQNAALYAQRADFALIPKGYYNAVTNATIDGALTNTPNSGFANGAFYEVSVSGTSQISGANFTTATVLNIGDRIEKIGTQWNLKPNPTTNYSLNLEVQKQLKVVKPVLDYVIDGFGANGGNPFPLSAKYISVPNTTNGSGTGLTFTVQKPSTYSVGDTLYVEIIIDENVANITNYSGQILEFNLNVKRNTSGTITTVNNAATSTGFQRLGVTQVLLSFTYLVTANDVEFTYVIQKPLGGVTNNSGGGWIWYIKYLNYYLTKSGETLLPISAELNNLYIRSEKNRNDIRNSNLSYVENTLIHTGEAKSGATYSASKLTIPVGSHGEGSNLGVTFEFENSPYKLEMVGKNVTFEYIFKTSANILNTKSVFMRNFVYVSGGAGGITSGLTTNEEITIVDSTHIKVKFDCLLLDTYTDIRPNIQINDFNAVTGAPVTIETLNNIFYYWTTSDQKNLNTDVLTHTLATFKEDVLGNFDLDRSVWEGNGIVWCGTSIPASHTPNSYPEIIGRKLNATIYNTAIGGSRIVFNGDGQPGMSGSILENTNLSSGFAAQSYENTIMKYLAAPYNAKLVVIDHTANDIGGFPTTLGNINSTTKDTFYGAYDFVIKQILTNYPDTRIVLVTIPNRYFDSIVSQEAARTAIKQIGDKWGFPVLDLAGVMGMNQITSAPGQMTYDQIHPTAATAVRIANVGYRFLLGVS